MSETHQDIQSGPITARQYIQQLKTKYPKFSSSQIAKKINLAQPTFNKIENGQTLNPSLATMSKILSGLGKSHKIADAIEKLGHKVDRKYIKIKGEAIKNLGAYEATIRLHKDVAVDIKFDVIAAAAKKK